ncbi:MAG: FAD-dependent oxidoreductase [Candidatus Methylomirabilia bacterium]
MMTQLKRLFSARKIGGVEIRNRTVLSPMGIMLKPTFVDGELNPRLVEFFEARARGGVGLIIVSGAYTEEKARAFAEHGVGIWDDHFIPVLNKLVEALHRHGARVGLHLLHGGSYARQAITDTQPLSASASFTNWLTKETPREVTREEIKEIVKAFGKAVKRAKDAGFDLVEYNAYSGYLIREFLSPRTNKRTDEYGGELENRLRFFKEIIHASREEVGSEYALIAKISGDEYLPGGNGLREAIQVAKALESWGIDGIHVSPAGHETGIPLTPGFTPKGAFLYLAQAVKEQIKVPLITAHIGDVLLAEQVLADGKADFIALGRALLADPELPVKAVEGRFEDIIPCIRCVQGCYDRVFVEEEVTCFMNPATGREKEFKIKPAARKKKVMVIGGGPGGMEAALIAAQRGHQVVLYERSSRLGGQLNACTIPPGKEDFANAIVYFSTQLAKHGIEVKLNTDVTPEVVEGEVPDTVIVATGAQLIIPDIAGVDRGNLYTAFEVLEGESDIGRRVVVVGGGGIGCETALYLAKLGAMDSETAVFLMTWKALDPETALRLTMKGRKVTILEMLPAIARDIGMARRGFLRRVLAMHEVNVITRARVTAITEEGVQFVDQDEKTQTVPADTVVLAVGTRSSNDMYQKLQGRVPELYIIGDAKQPRKAMDAIHEAATLAKEL